MAFPQVSDADTKSGTVGSNSNSWTLTYPTNLANGDLVLAFAAVDGNSTGTFPAGWVAISTANPGGDVTLVRAKKLSDGTETGNFTLGISANEQGAWRLLRIPAAGWEGTLGTQFAKEPLSGSVAGVAAGGTSANPDPFSLDPDNWATEDTLWIAVMAGDANRTVTGYPASYTNTATDNPASSGGAYLGIARLESAVSSEDPGTFTISASDDWVAGTIAIRPAAAAAAAVPYRSLMGVGT